MADKMGPVDILPERIKKYLNSRGLSNEVLAHNKVSWDGEHIVIPVFDEDGIWLFNKYRRDPDVTFGPKYTYDKGATAILYGADKAKFADKVIICEGEFDALILEEKGFTAVCSTGGAGTFREEWIERLKNKDLYVCFDNDKAGEQGVMRIAKMCPTVKYVPLPPAVGDHGDVTDYFIKLGRTAKDFRLLMEVAEVIKLEPEKKEAPRKRAKVSADSAERLKAAKEVPLTTILRFNGQKFARCPFHTDKTPSLHIFGANRCKCFSCGFQGDTVDLTMRMHNLPMKEAIDHLLKI
jgi:DNA primase